MPEQEPTSEMLGEAAAEVSATVEDGGTESQTASEPETRDLNVGSTSTLPIVPGGGNKLPEIGSPSILPIVPEGP